MTIISSESAHTKLTQWEKQSKFSAHIILNTRREHVATIKFRATERITEVVVHIISGCDAPNRYFYRRSMGLGFTREDECMQGLTIRGCVIKDHNRTWKDQFLDAGFDVICAMA